MSGFLYCVQVPGSDQSTFKVGRTRSFEDRGYPRATTILVLVAVDNQIEKETELLHLLRRTPGITQVFGTRECFRGNKNTIVQAVRTVAGENGMVNVEVREHDYTYLHQQMMQCLHLHMAEVNRRRSAAFNKSRNALETQLQQLDILATVRLSIDPKEIGYGIPAKL